MTKKIRKSIIMVSSITLISAILLIVGSLYGYFTDIQKGNSKANLNLVATGVSQNGLIYLEKLSIEDYRITWIDEDGTVLYDSKADKDAMENHGDREEFLEAVKSGYGESERNSATLYEETVYSAKKLSDNTVVRISFTHLTILSLLTNMIPIITIVIIVSLLLSILLASKTGKKIIVPLNSLDLGAPLQNDVYEEINPLLHRINKQNIEISSQIETLKRQKNEISFILKNVTEGIIIINEKGKVLSCNKVAQDLLSCKEDTYFLNYFRDISYEKLIEDAMFGKDGTVKINIGKEIFLFSASPIKTLETTYSVFLFIHNITEEEHSSEIRRQFSANVSHELKTPLTSIMGASELLANGMVQSEDIKVFANNIYSEAQRLLKLVQDIIKLSKLDEKINFEFEITDLSKVTKDVISHLNKKAKDKNITIKSNISPAEIGAVSTVLYEMLYNLIDNAIDYNKLGGEVFIDISKTERNIIWKIKDTGLGIPKEDLSRIFERFYRVDKSHSKESGGTGLGLSIVKNGANLHNAKIDINSTLGKGTEITLTFAL